MKNKFYNRIKRIIHDAWQRNFVRSIVWYVVTIFISAFIYWLIFNFNTTSFVISDQLNKHVSVYYYFDPEVDLANYNKESKYLMPITIGEFNNIMKPQFERLDSVNRYIRELNENSSKTQQKLDSLVVVADRERADSISAYRLVVLRDYQFRIDSMNNYLAGRDSTKMIIEGKYVELAQLKQQYAIKDVECSTYIIEHWGSFISSGLSEEIGALNRDNISLLTVVMQQESLRRELTANIRDSIIRFHLNRRETVGFWDFVYYSICVSTTVSFGDIAPNNSITRLFTVLELLSCLCLLGFIVDRIIHRRQ